MAEYGTQSSNDRRWGSSNVRKRYLWARQTTSFTAAASARNSKQL